MLLNIPAVATFYLAWFAPADEFRGKQVQLLLWDAGERADNIQILDNNGNPAPFQYQTWSPGIVGYPNDTAIPLSGATTSLDVSGGLAVPDAGLGASTRFNQQKFNDRMSVDPAQHPHRLRPVGPVEQRRLVADQVHVVRLSLKDLSTWSVRCWATPSTSSAAEQGHPFRH